MLIESLLRGMLEMALTPMTRLQLSELVVREELVDVGFVAVLDVPVIPREPVSALLPNVPGAR